MKLSEDLTWRGLIKDKTFDNVSWLDTPKTFYLGIDASSDSLTIGNLAVILLARRLAAAGWKAVLLAGGATSLVGDPGGKESERELKTKEEIAKNVEVIKKQIEKLFDGIPHEMVNNLDWLGKEGYLDFLRDVGKYYSMTELMQRDFVTARMNEGGSGISYAEFSYSLLQGYDFWWLFKNKGVEVQIGASDQWGNMLSGVPLIRKKEGKEVNAFSMPLVINKETGVKFGKSEEGAVWLDPKRTSPSQFYQFWINTGDEAVEDYLKIYTFLDEQEIKDVMKAQSNDPSSRSAQIRLAEEVTKIVHGNEAVEGAKEHADNLRSGNMTQAVKLPSGVSLVEVLVNSGLCESNSEARRVVADGGVYIDNQPTAAEVLNASDFKDGRLLLRKGKKLQNSVLIELE